MTNKLHIFAQPYWHQAAFIVGDREALVRLKEALDAVLDTNNAGYDTAEASFDAFTADGEGYKTIILCREENDVWNKIAMPYTDENTVGSEDENALWGHQLCADYKKLMERK